jgi:serine/threonine protein kinase
MIQADSLPFLRTGMAYLHAASVLHCDLKPANVLLKATSADRRGFVCKLADFGLSRLLDDNHKTHLSTQTYGVRTCISFQGFIF